MNVTSLSDEDTKEKERTNNMSIFIDVSAVLMDFTLRTHTLLIQLEQKKRTKQDEHDVLTIDGPMKVRRMFY